MFNFLNKPSKPSLTPEQAADWDRDGYLILRGFIDRATIDAVNEEIDRIVRGHAPYPEVTVDILNGPYVHQRFKLSNAPAAALDAAVKINDLFLDSETIRACNIGSKLAGVLRELLDGDPLVCNSLNFLYGSNQGAHYDSWFMPPLVENKMLATSICLEEVHERNGPVFLYPGSHKIPPFRFPHGGIGKLGADLQPAIDYAMETTKDIAPTRILGEAGDVLIWHGQLLHGGSPIADPSLTRKSLVTHYFRAVDTERRHKRKIARGAYIMNRPHPHVH